MKTRMLAFYALLFLIAGCIPVLSLHPLYEEKDLIFEKKLLGTWIDDSNNIWDFKKFNDNKNYYELSFIDKENEKGLFIACLLKLNDKYFLDVFLTESPCGEKNEPNNFKYFYNAFLMIPAHTFIKVNSIEPQLKLQATDDEKIKELFKKDPNAITHEIVNGNNPVVLTASTKELQKFVLKYADDERLFTKEKILKRKISEPNDPNNVPARKNKKCLSD